jgi:acyl-CoA synthetase (AMP-forming)/AMP-acid ligase II
MTPFPRDTIQQYTKLGAWGTSKLIDLFNHNAATKPLDIALVDAPNKAEFSIGPPRRLTYEKLCQDVDRLAAIMLSEGFHKDDIILVQIPNIIELVILYLAAAKLGLIVSPIPVQYRIKEIRRIVSTIAPKAFFTSTKFKKFNHAKYFVENMGTFEAKIYAWGNDLPVGAKSLNTLLLEESDERKLSDYVDALDTTANDIFSICWTSGTEGKPKGVPRTHNNWLTTGAGNIDGVGLQHGDCLLIPFPAVNMASIGALLVPWLMLCGKLVLHHPFDLKVFLNQIQNEKVNYTVAAPALLNMILKDEAHLRQTDISTLKYLGTGSAPPDVWMMKKFQEKYGLAIANFFGSNEGTPLCAGHADIPNPEKRAKYFPRAGVEDYQWRNRAANWMQTKLIDPENGAVIDKPGRPGELAVCGPSLFPGYYKRGKFDRTDFDAEGYFHTGDLFEIATDGYVPCYYRFVGRKKDLIIRGGMNISPAELDDLLSGHPGVLEAAVAGYPDEIMGERVCAFVVPRSGEKISLEHIVTYLTEIGVAPYKMPERMVLVSQLPRNPLNKVLRHELGAILENEISSQEG